MAVYDSYQQPGWQVFGGTNVAEAIIAGVYALAPPSGGFLNEYPYTDPSDLFDVTSGSNGSCGTYLCNAVAGYDGPTGLGTPDGAAAFGPATTGNDFSLSVSPETGSVIVGSTKTVTVSTSTRIGSPEPVSLSVRGGPPETSLSPTTVTSGQSATLTIPTTDDTPTGTYTLTITGTGTSRTQFATYKLKVKLPPCPSGGQKLVNRGFEGGTNGWDESRHLIGKWSPQEPPYSGSRDAWLGGKGAAHGDSLSQTVAIPTGCTSYRLSFWLHIDTAETTNDSMPDTLTVSLGEVTLARFSNLNANFGYKRHAFNVASFAGEDPELKFTAVEDNARQTSFVIDDTALRVR